MKKIKLEDIHNLKEDDLVKENENVKVYDIEEIYGVSIIDYLSIHNKTIDELINEVKININILRSNLKERLANNDLDDLTEVIENKLEHKRQHLKRLEEFKKLYKL